MHSRDLESAQNLPRRLVLPMDGSSDKAYVEDVVPDAEQLLGSYFELPATNGAFRGRVYRYAYGISAVRPTNIANALAKVDVAEGRVCGANQTPLLCSCASWTRCRWTVVEGR